MKSALESIKKRISIRTYAPTPVDEQTQTRLEKSFKKNKIGPFGNGVRFKLLDLSKVTEEELRQLGTYGVIKRAKLYILAAVNEGEKTMEDLGYCLEMVIMEATALGLGTCWLAGTFRRSRFAGQMNLSEKELLPAITPVGYAADSISMVERIMRFASRARKRKPWSELFYQADGNSPLLEEEAGSYREVLEAVRMGPSASNRQPWRIVQEEGGLYRLYLAENVKYNRVLGKIRIQNIDMGIAMCHFELAAKETGHAGNWQKPVRIKELPNLAHIADWVPKG